jgi:hypothetical protein
MTPKGRPSKLTPEVTKTLIDAIGLGASYKDASEAAGISYSLFAEWMQKGREQKKGEFVDFMEAVRAEEAAAALRHLAVINNAAAKGEWKASLEWLRARRKTEWGNAVDITSDNKALKGYVIISPDDWDKVNDGKE